MPLLSGPMGWVKYAACRDHAPELFDEFPRVPYLSDFGRINIALTVCAGCPVRRQCLELGTAHKNSGVHGGRLLVAGRPLDGPSMERRLNAARRREAQLRGRRLRRHVA